MTSGIKSNLPLDTPPLSKSTSFSVRAFSNSFFISSFSSNKWRELASILEFNNAASIVSIFDFRIWCGLGVSLTATNSFPVAIVHTFGLPLTFTIAFPTVAITPISAGVIFVPLESSNAPNFSSLPW